MKTEDILEDLQKKRRNKKIFLFATIGIIAVVLAIFAILGYAYFTNENNISLTNLTNNNSAINPLDNNLPVPNATGINGTTPATNKTTNQTKPKPTSGGGSSGGTITCTPDCAGKQCGDNGCQGSCGACNASDYCNSTGQCVKNPASCTTDLNCTSFNRACGRGLCNLTIKSCYVNYSEERSSCSGGICHLGSCVRCINQGDCGVNESCIGGNCVNEQTCNTDVDCTYRGPGFFCNATSHNCEWKPPIGIPKPTFGIEETYRMYDEPANRNPNLTYTQNSEGGFYTSYVDNTHPNATDTDNIYGTAEKPRLTVPYAVSGSFEAGSVLEIHGGSYAYGKISGNYHRHYLSGMGSVSQPIFIRGTTEMMPQFNDTRFIMNGYYIIVENLKLRSSVLHESQDRPGCHHLSYRKIDCWGGFPDTGTCTNAYDGHDIVVYNNHFHDNGDTEYIKENDFSGFFASDAGSHDIWIVDNYMHGNGGDSVLIGSSGHGTSLDYVPTRVYIGRNVMDAEGENAVDLKHCKDVIVSQNTAIGFHMPPYGSSDGTPFIVNDDDPHGDIWFLANTVINSTGSFRFEDGAYLIGNVVINSGGPGAYSYKNITAYMFLNTIIGGGMWWGSGTLGTIHLADNIIVNPVASNNLVTVLSPLVAARSTMSNNLLYSSGGPARISWGQNSVSNYYEGLTAFQTITGKGEGCVEADPQFKDAANNDFHLHPTSPAIDNGTSSGVVQEAFDKFYDLYSIDIRKDIEGRMRPQGAGLDIGAYEYNSASLGDHFLSDPNYREGFGKLATGGAGYPIYIVTSSAASGPGTFDSFFQPGNTGSNRNIVFAVSNFTIPGGRYVGSNVTIDGCVNGLNGVTLDASATGKRSLVIEGPASNVVVRCINFRGTATPGGGGASFDLLALDGGSGLVSNVFVDRCTFINSTDGALDITGDVSDVSVQRSLFYGNAITMLIKYGSRRNISIHHNIFTRNGERNPQVKGDINLIDFVNNIEYLHDVSGYSDGTSTDPYGVRIWGAGASSDSPGNVIGNFASNAFLDSGTQIVLMLDNGGTLEGIYLGDNLCSPASNCPSSPKPTSNPVPAEYAVTALAPSQFETKILPYVGSPNRLALDQQRIDDVAAALNSGIGGSSAQAETTPKEQLHSEQASLSWASQIYNFFKGFLTGNMIKEITGYFLRTG